MVVVGRSKSELCLGRRSVYIVAFWHTGLNLAVWPLAVVVDVCSSVGGIAIRPITILYIIVAFILALPSAKVGHCRVCSIDVTLLRFVGNCSSRSGQIFFALLLVFVCSERCVDPIPYRHIQATVLQVLNSKWISSLWGNDVGSAG